MASILTLYQLGNTGVNRVKSPYHMADTDLLKAQNVELVLDRNTGGAGTLSKRGGYVTLVDFAASIVEMYDVRFINEL